MGLDFRRWRQPETPGRFCTHRGVRGDTVLRPTRAGVYARRLWPRILPGVEERWRAHFGADLIDALRDALLAVATPMSWSPPELHPSDGFRTHVADEGGAPTRSARWWRCLVRC